MHSHEIDQKRPNLPGRNAQSLFIGFLVIIASCTSTPDFGDFAEEYTQNKSSYDRYLKSWDLVTSDARNPQGRLIFGADGIVKFEGIFAQKAKEFCGKDALPYVLGKREENPEKSAYGWAYNETILLPCGEENSGFRARWFRDGKLELYFEAFRIVGNHNVVPSLVQPASRGESENKSKCQYSPEGTRLLAKYKGKLNQGRFGGGYDKIKWGMCREEIAALYPQHRQFDNGLELTINNLTITVSFHEGLAHGVSIKDSDDYNEFDRAKIIGILSSKYGRPRVVDKVSKTDISKSTRTVYKWSNQTNIFSDGTTEIHADSCKTFGTGFFHGAQYGERDFGYCTIADTYTKEILYSSKILNEEILKLKKAAERQQQAETARKY